jgi:hypothetical protein
VLGASGSVSIQPASPTATTSPTATPTPTEPGPAPLGTSLEATLSAEASSAGVRGEVCATNTGDHPTTGLQALLRVQAHQRGGPFADLPGVELLLAPLDPLAPGVTTCLPYEIPFQLVGARAYRVAAQVTITNHSGWLPGGPHCPGPDACPYGPDPKAGFEPLAEAAQAAATATATAEAPTQPPTDAPTQPPTDAPLEPPADTATPTATPSGEPTPLPSPTATDPPPADPTTTEPPTPTASPPTVEPPLPSPRSPLTVAGMWRGP